MARKRKHEEHENHERWLVSYADFITLLFAFFVVMYSISSVNEGKYRVLSDALSAAFRAPASSLNPIQIGQPIRSPNVFAVNANMSPRQTLGQPININIPTPMPDVSTPPLAEQGGGAGLDEISRELDDAFEKLIDQDLVNVRKNPFRLEIEVNSKILFQSGSSVLARDAVPVIAKLAGILEEFDNKVQVEGFTDNQPIRSPVYPSNWELSAGRAATVVRMFSEFGVAPKRLSSVGFGEHQPIASNATAAGRTKNRRVVIVVKAKQSKTTPKELQKLRDQIERMASTPLPDLGGADGSTAAPQFVQPVYRPEVEAAEELL